jgi:hypothetical protein
MPYIDGETLRDKLDRETQLGIDESVRIATDAFPSRAALVDSKGSTGLGRGRPMSKTILGTPSMRNMIRRLPNVQHQRRRAAPSAACRCKRAHHDSSSLATQVLEQKLPCPVWGRRLAQIVAGSGIEQHRAA